MALYQSIHTGLEIDQAVSAVSGLTSTVSGHTTQINEIEQDIVYLSGVTSGNTQSIVDINNDIIYLSGITSGHTFQINEINNDIIYLSGITSGHTTQINQLNNTVTGHTVSINSLLNVREITKESTGFVNCDNVVVTYNKTNRTITLTGTFSAYYKGELISVLTNGWTSDPHPVGTGTFFLYYGDSGFVFNNTPWTFDCLQIAYAQVNSHQFGLRETHGFMPWETHKELHQRIGTYLTAGGTMTSYVLNSTTAVNRRPDVNTTTIQDEDLATTLPSLTGKIYTQRRITGAGVRVFTTNQPEIIYASGNTVYYDYNNAGTWSKATIPNNNYAALYLVAIPVTADADSQLFRYVWVQPQTYGALPTIQSITPNNLTLGDSENLVSEFVFIGKVIINVVGNNWTLYSVELLTGDKSNQTSSPSGNYLSVVNSDDTINGDGTSGSPLSVATYLEFSNVTGSTWVADTTYSGYGYKCDLTAAGATSSMIAFVNLGHIEAISGNYSPVCNTGTDIVTIYSKVNTTITIPSIIVFK